MSINKVIVIGIDGGEFSILKVMIRKGLMPNLDSMIKRGFATNIDTYVKGPGQGWVSFITGKSPEKHGVFYWNLYKRLINSQFIKDKFLWEILSENGISSCVINMSYTYPPRPFNGYLIAGLGSSLSMSEDMKITYPETLMEEIKKNIGDYIISCEYRDGSVDDHKKLISDLIRMTKYRTKACLYIMEKYSPEFVLVVFRGADLIQHCYWNLLEPSIEISETNKPIKTLIESYYQELDHSIGQICKKYDKSIKIIISDHGFGPVKAIVYLNHYLAKRGFLYKKQESKKRKISFLILIRSVLKFFYKKILINYEFFRKLNQIRKNIQGVDLPIDKKQTIAYSEASFGVNINKQSVFIKDKDINKIKKDVIKCLQELKDPQTNINVIEKIYLKEDPYAKNLRDAPDIIYEANENYLVTHEMSLENNIVFKYMDKKEIAFFTGSHRRLGIFIIDGDQIKILKKKDIKITDITSSILNIFNVNIPSDLDGQIIFEKQESP